MPLALSDSDDDEEEEEVQEEDNEEEEESDMESDLGRKQDDGNTL